MGLLRGHCEFCIEVAHLLRWVTGYVALAALFIGYPFALKWPRMSKYIKVNGISYHSRPCLHSVASDSNTTFLCTPLPLIWS